MTDTSQQKVRVGNMTELQLPVPIVGVNGDLDQVLLQPKSSTWLPPGYTAAEPLPRGLYVFPQENVAKEQTTDTGGKSK